ncbi:hypothetical protein FB451DRAFT_1529584 [Mycena latifolia]|nr:hypothetical protein FB451DRAFT_1529584 [Mycena latifolia]
MSDRFPGEKSTVLEQQRPCDFPDEILLDIFHHALPPSWVMSSSEALAPFPPIWSADVRTKLAIVGVCKTWHHLGLELLYESVILQQIGQLPAFVRALEAREGLRALVRHLEISCFLPRGYFRLYDEETKKLFALCPNLSHFAFTPGFTLYRHSRLIPALPSTITSLEYGAAIEYSAILPSLVHLCATLRSLSLTLPDTYGADHPTLTFASLEDLRLDLAVDSTIPVSEWVIPGLRRAVLRNRFRLGFPAYMKRETQLEVFLGAYGRTIRTLMISYLQSRSLQDLLDRCPVLEHLGVSMALCAAPLNHATLTSVDIFNSSSFADGDFGGLKGALPALRACKYLDDSLALENFRDLSLALPAGDVVVTDQASVSNLPFSSWLTAILSEVGAADDPSDDDPDYVFNSDDDDDGGSVDDSDSSSNSDSDAVSVSEEGGDEFHLEENWEIESEEALAIFRSTLR